MPYLYGALGNLVKKDLYFSQTGRDHHKPIYLNNSVIRSGCGSFFDLFPFPDNAEARARGGDRNGGEYDHFLYALVAGEWG